MSIKLRIDNIGEDNFYNARAVNLNIGGRVIKTPMRALTYQELNSKADVPDEVTLNSDVSVIFKKLSSTEVAKLMATNPYPKRQIDFIEDYKARMQHSSAIFSLLQPSRGVLTEHGFDRDKYLRIVSDIQKESGLKFISFPWLGYDSTTLLQKYKVFDNYCGNSSEPVFILDIAAQPRELEVVLPYIKSLVLSGRIHLLGILYKRKKDALASYDLLWKFLKELEVGIVLLDVPREDLGSLSASHVQEFVLGDMIALTSVRGFGSKDEDIIKKPIKDRIKMFNSPDLKIAPISKLESGEWIDKISPSFVKNSEIIHALKNYSEAENNQDKERVLRAISKAHEFIESSKEFTSSRKYIQTGEIDYYLGTKQELLNSLKTPFNNLSTAKAMPPIKKRKI